ncbi:PAS domain S-box protein [soil metagenome]
MPTDTFSDAFLYELTLNNLREYALFVMDVHGVVLTWHPGVEAVFGYARDAFVGHSGLMIFTEEQRRTGVPQKEMTQAAETGYGNDERWHLRADGSQFWAVGIMSALRDDNGELLGFTKIVRDNTDKKRADDALSDLNATLLQQVETRTRQVRDLASELTLAEERERRRLAQLVHDELQQQLFALQIALHKVQADAPTVEPALSILKDAIQLARSLSVEISPPALQAGFAAGLRWLQEHMLERYGLNIELNLPSEEPELSEPVKLLLFQIARELLFNIVKHANVQDATVTVQRETDELRLDVIDEGDGFSGDLPGNTAGFGLASVRQRLELYGGGLEVVAQPGSGTRATVRLPERSLN